MKRCSALVLTLIMLFLCFSVPAVAATGTEEQLNPQVSLQLTGYSATLGKGSVSGQIKITYAVNASNIATELGVAKIVIKTEDDSVVAEITGTTTNGLILQNNMAHSGNYYYKGSTNMSYKAEVTVYAKIGSAADYRTVETEVVNT